jgi:arylsulfatase A-like enzyme
MRNVLLIVADQFRWDCLGAAGNPVIQTPHLDGLAREGVLFRNCFVQTCPCGPSRMCLMTGRYLCATRAVDNYTPLADAEDNLGVFLKRAGYRCAAFGYHDYSVDPRTLRENDPRLDRLSFSNFLPGFDDTYLHEYHSPEYFAMLRERGYPEEWCGPRICTEYNVPESGPGEHLPLRYPAYYRAEDSECRFLTGKVIDYLRENSDGGWFVNVNYIKPHPPRICPAPYHGMYDPASMPAPNRRPDELKSVHPYLRVERQIPELREELEWREMRACYYGMISEIDACIGILLEETRRLGRWKDTLIIFTSDHGEYLGDHYFLDKAHFYDETMRVPLIIRDPTTSASATRGGSVATLAESVDLTPTILAFLDVPITDRVQGASLLGVVRGDSTGSKGRVHFESDFRNRWDWSEVLGPDECLLWVVRGSRYKYVQFAHESLTPLLFDFQTDPGEHVNLAERAEYAGVVTRYCQHLLRWRMKHEDQRMEHWASNLRSR